MLMVFYILNLEIKTLPTLNTYNGLYFLLDLQKKKKKNTLS